MSHHNSPHLSHLNGSAPSSPSMSQAQQTNSQPRAYPEPTSYPSPSAYPEPNTSYASYPAPNGQQGSEPYRASASPAGSNGSLPLPSMRSLDSLHPHQQQMHPQSPMPYYAHQTMGQMPHPPHQYPNVTSDPAMANMRYALPVTDQRQMSGGRHKKEIKRRTKTGCLTCRKRRIKCDEQHPTCRNCQKSKRECLGYDPIFKQTPQPAQIQPAPQGIPQSTAPGINSNPYGAQPQMLQSGYGLQVTQVGYEQALSAGVSSPGSNGQQFDYASAIDPALEAAAPSAAASAIMTAQYPNPAPLAQAFENGTTGFAAASKFSIEELLAMGGPAPELPADQNSVQNPQIIDEQKHLYHSIYSVGLENFLESKWFPIKGVARLLADKDLMIQFGNLLQRLANTRGDDAAEMAITSGVEARLVWALACMVRSAATSEEAPSPVSNEPANDDVLNAKLRLDIFENLLCGETAESNPLPEPSTTVTPPHRVRELNFWYNLGKFVSLNPDKPGAIEKIDQTLTTLRNLLDGRENRDVLYSIAIVRVLGARIAEYTEQDTPLHLDENDQRSRLLVAKKFIEDEARGNGTTNVIRRLCELAVRTWSSPRREQSATTA